MGDNIENNWKGFWEEINRTKYSFKKKKSTISSVVFYVLIWKCSMVDNKICLTVCGWSSSLSSLSSFSSSSFLSSSKLSSLTSLSLFSSPKNTINSLFSIPLHHCFSTPKNTIIILFHSQTRRPLSLHMYVSGVCEHFVKNSPYGTNRE